MLLELCAYSFFRVRVCLLWFLCNHVRSCSIEVIKYYVILLSFPTCLIYDYKLLQVI